MNFDRKSLSFLMIVTVYFLWVTTIYKCEYTYLCNINSCITSTERCCSVRPPFKVNIFEK
jgi:hypothetical protein